MIESVLTRRSNTLWHFKCIDPCYFCKKVLVFAFLWDSSFWFLCSLWILSSSQAYIAHVLFANDIKSMINLSFLQPSRKLAVVRLSCRLLLSVKKGGCFQRRTHPALFYVHLKMRWSSLWRCMFTVTDNKRKIRWPAKI